MAAYRLPGNRTGKILADIPKTLGKPRETRMIGNATGEALKTADMSNVPSIFQEYRRQGHEIHGLLISLEKERAQYIEDGCSLWEIPHPLPIALTFAWNAYVRQVLGEKLVSTDMLDTSPKDETFAQAELFYKEVEPWFAAAKSASEIPDYPYDIETTAPLPSWRCARSECSVAQLEAALNTCTELEFSTKRTLALFSEKASSPEELADQSTFKQMAENIASAIAAARHILRNNLLPEEQLNLEDHTLNALALLSSLGQLLSKPNLSDKTDQYAKYNPVSERWRLTDPDERIIRAADPKYVDELNRWWKQDPNHKETLALGDAIDTALQVEAIKRFADANPHQPSFWDTCPWPSIYHVHRPVTIAGNTLAPGDNFVADLSPPFGTHGQKHLRIQPTLPRSPILS